MKQTLENADGVEGQVYRSFAQGKPRVVSFRQLLPSEALEMTLPHMGRAFPNAPVSTRGETVTMDRLAASVEGQAYGETAMGTAHTRAIDVSRSLHNLFCSLPILAPWRRKAPLLWISGSQMAPLHIDAWDNVLVQLAGRKRFVVYDAEASRHIRQWNVGVAPTNQLGGRLTDPAAAHFPALEGWLEPGDALVIPCGSMHALFGSPDSVSANLFLTDGPPPKFTDLRYQYMFKYWIWVKVVGWVPKIFDRFLSRVNIVYWRTERRYFQFLRDGWRDKVKENG